MIQNLKIIPLGNHIFDCMDELARLDKDVFGKYKSWTKENFLLDMPHKNQLSKLAIINGESVGYIICSSYNKNGHIHRLAVSGAYQHRCIGTALLKEFAKNCLKMGVIKITAETSRENIIANKFYKRIGFEELGGVELKDYLSKKGKIKEIQIYIDREIVYCIKVKDILNSLVF